MIKIDFWSILFFIAGGFFAFIGLILYAAEAISSTTVMVWWFSCASIMFGRMIVNSFRGRSFTEKISEEITSQQDWINPKLQYWIEFVAHKEGYTSISSLSANDTWCFKVWRYQMRDENSEFIPPDYMAAEKAILPEYRVFIAKIEFMDVQVAGKIQHTYCFLDLTTGRKLSSVKSSLDFIDFIDRELPLLKARGFFNIPTETTVKLNLLEKLRGAGISPFGLGKIGLEKPKEAKSG